MNSLMHRLLTRYCAYLEISEHTFQKNRNTHAPINSLKSTKFMLASIGNTTASPRILTYTVLCTLVWITKIGKKMLKYLQSCCILCYFSSSASVKVHEDLWTRPLFPGIVMNNFLYHSFYVQLYPSVLETYLTTIFLWSFGMHIHNRERAI